MILVTGGAYQGKLKIAKTLWKQNDSQSAAQPTREPSVAEGNLAEFEQLQRADIINQFQLWIRRLSQEESVLEEKRLYSLTEKLLQENPRAVIILEQVGCGLVPMEAQERLYRETVGRMGCFLAQKAEEVYLVNCGIAKRIK